MSRRRAAAAPCPVQPSGPAGATAMACQVRVVSAASAEALRRIAHADERDCVSLVASCARLGGAKIVRGRHVRDRSSARGGASRCSESEAPCVDRHDIVAQRLRGLCNRSTTFTQPTCKSGQLEWSLLLKHAKSAWSNEWPQERSGTGRMVPMREGEHVGSTSRQFSTAQESAEAGIESLWSEFKRTGEQALRNQLIIYYSPFVKYIAGRVLAGLPRHFDEEDLVSYGIIGLIDAIERFELDRNLRFETYAIPRIKGAIIDELRSIDWVPRSVRTKARAVEQAFTHSGGDPAAHAQRGRGRGRTGDVGRRLPQGAAQDLDRRHDGARRGAARRRPLRALDAGRDLAGRVVGPGRHLRGQGVQGGAGRGRRRHARAGADRADDVLLRRPHPDGDRPGARRHREQGVPDPHEGAPPAPLEVGRPSRDRSPVATAGPAPPAGRPGAAHGAGRPACSCSPAERRRGRSASGGRRSPARRSPCSQRGRPPAGSTGTVRATDCTEPTGSRIMPLHKRETVREDTARLGLRRPGPDGRPCRRRLSPPTRCAGRGVPGDLRRAAPRRQRPPEPGHVLPDLGGAGGPQADGPLHRQEPHRQGRVPPDGRARAPLRPHAGRPVERARGRASRSAARPSGRRRPACSAGWRPSGAGGPSAGPPGKPTDTPNMVCGPVQVVWHKFARYWDIEMREIPMSPGRYCMDVEQMLERVDENTIMVVPTFGVTYTGCVRAGARALPGPRQAAGGDRPRHRHPRRRGQRGVPGPLLRAGHPVGLPGPPREVDQHLGAQVRAGAARRGLGAVAGRGGTARRPDLPRHLPRRRHAGVPDQLLPPRRPDRGAVLQLRAARPGRLPQRARRLLRHRQVPGRGGRQARPVRAAVRLRPPDGDPVGGLAHPGGRGPGLHALRRRRPPADARAGRCRPTR